MAQERTLLAHLVPRITSRVEDAATDALAFILNRSKVCRGALDGLLRADNFEIDPIVRFETQVTYKDGSRPDMVGYDRSGAKRLLVESKFWASLLEGQASGYFGQLEEDGLGILLFIAPDSRIETLWAEIRHQMESGEKRVRLSDLKSPGRTRRAKVEGSDKQLMLTSWTLLLDGMATAVADDTTVASDIQQLRGLAKHQDEEAFLPIHLKEFGLALPRRIRGLNRLIDDVIDAHGVRQGWITVKGFRAAPQREGYGRYFAFTDVPGDLFLGINYKLWATSGDTPLWLRITSRVPLNRKRMLERMPSLSDHMSPGSFTVPIHLRAGVEYQAVVDDVVRLVKQFAGMVDKP